MLDITAFCNALHQGKVSFVASLGVGPYIDTDGSVVAIAGDDAVVFRSGPQVARRDTRCDYRSRAAAVAAGHGDTPTSLG